MVEASRKSYKERMREARAAARAERLAHEAAHRRMVELRVAVRREAEAMVRKQIADRGERVWHYLPKDIRAMAQDLITPALVAQARARIAARTVHTLSQSATSPAPSDPISEGIS